MRVWGIYYKVKANDIWSKTWTGPCGVYAFNLLKLDSTICSYLEGRPFFFRTRKQAKDLAKQMDLKCTREDGSIWSKHIVKPSELIYGEV